MGGEGSSGREERGGNGRSEKERAGGREKIECLMGCLLNG